MVNNGHTKTVPLKIHDDNIYQRFVHPAVALQKRKRNYHFCSKSHFLLQVRQV